MKENEMSTAGSMQTICEKTLREGTLGRICGRRKVAFKCILKKEDIECVHLDQCVEKRQAPLSTIMSLWVT
jgi:hypothetical protein